jgi:hypothetical protein
MAAGVVPSLSVLGGGRGGGGDGPLTPVEIDFDKCFYSTSPYPRYHIEWTPVPNAVSYQVFWAHPEILYMPDPFHPTFDPVHADVFTYQNSFSQSGLLTTSSFDTQSDAGYFELNSKFYVFAYSKTGARSPFPNTHLETYQTNFALLYSVFTDVSPTFSIAENGSYYPDPPVIGRTVTQYPTGIQMVFDGYVLFPPIRQSPGWY